MKAFLICSLFILSSFLVFSQKSPIKFGEIPMEDMKMISYPLDSSADAVILCDYGEAYIQSNINSVTMTFERHRRIKILKSSGTEWANASIPLYFSGSAEERVTNLKAVSYNLEAGKVVETKMEKESVFKEKFNRNYNIQKFTVPNVKEGTVVEYSYKVISEFFSVFPNWQFQETIPTRHSEYWAIMPEFFFYEKYLQGYVPMTGYEVKDKSSADFNTKAHHWIVKDVPAFKAEPFMTSEDDYVSKINFALSYVQFPGQPTQEIMGSWEKLNKTLIESEYFGTVIERSGFLKNVVAELLTGIEDPIQKVSTIHSYVKNNVEWDGYKDFRADNLKKILERKKGTSGDINLLLGSMLDKAGFKVEMILLSTRDHGFIRQSYPMERQFNYTICSVQVGDKTLLLDATDRFLPYTVLPDRCLNGTGMVVSATNHRWINIETKIKAKTTVMGEFAMTDLGELKGKLSFIRDGYDAHAMRKNFDAKGETEYLKDFLGAKSWSIEKSEFKNIKDLDQSAKEEYQLTISEHATAAGDVIYVSPFVYGQFNKNPFTSENREYPVDFGSMNEKIYMVKFIVPEGFKVEEMPQSKVIQLPGNAARFMYNVSLTGNNLQITSNFQINRNIFTQVDYPNLREFYNQVVAKQAEQIVLKKQ
jgi:hypothetical protein